MKAIGFFLAVFLSMLAVFLIATGEVKRWFVPEPKSTIELGDVRLIEASKGGNGNIFEFPFYDFERAKLMFVIRAELVQDDFRVDAPLDDSAKLTLRNGVIEVPLEEEPLSETESPAKTKKPRKLTLDFKTAIYEKNLRGVDDKGGLGILEVLLKDGKGTTDDGTQFFFEELHFGRSEGSAYTLRSDKPVSIRHPAFGVMSPAGLDGTLEEHTKQEFRLRPPVSALFDAAGPSPLTPGTHDDPAAKDGRAKAQLLGITCQGPLNIRRQSSDAAGSSPATSVTFQKDVVIFPLDAQARLENLPAPRGTRFECQELLIELDDKEGRTLPYHGLATWEGSRVKAYIARNDEQCLVEADRIEWTRDVASEGQSKNAASASELMESVLALSEARLLGRPTLRTKDIFIEAERGTFQPGQSRVLLESPRGTLVYLASEDREAKKSAKGSDTAARRDDSSPEPAPPAIGEKPAAEPSQTAPSQAAPSQAKGPQLWDLVADEAEFYFAGVEGQTSGPGGEKKLAKFVARSREVNGVKISSRSSQPFEASSSTLTYLGPEQKATLEGTATVPPRFQQGKNWVESRRIHLFKEERTIWFEEDAHARIEDTAQLGSLGGMHPAASGAGQNSPSSPSGATASLFEPGEKGATDRGAAAPLALALEIDANFLALRFGKEAQALPDIAAKGSPGLPVTVTSLKTPWFRFSGRELLWDHELESAQLLGGRTASSAPIDPGHEEAAEVEVEGGELFAQQIRIDVKSWKAHLSDRVLVRSSPVKPPNKADPTEPPSLEIRTGRADVDFFERFGVSGPAREGVFKSLASVKALHAYQSQDAPIEIVGQLARAPFVARSEECTWDSSTRLLRFFGTKEQEIELQGESFRGPIRGREVAFDEAKQLLSIQGGVTGRIVQRQAARESGIAPPTTSASASPPGAGLPAAAPIVWQLETNVLEVQLQMVQNRDTPVVSTIHARDKIDLRSEELGIQLRGDDLIYEEATRKAHIFSPDGRPQTFVGERMDGKPKPSAAQGAPAGAGNSQSEESQVDRLNKIVSQEIWLLLYENPYAVAQRGDRTHWLLVQFDRDVIATIHVRPEDIGTRRVKEVGDVWKMVAERLTLFVDPSQTTVASAQSALQRTIPWAMASGKVVFTSGALQATADRAIYEEESSKMTFYGTPARLSRDNEPVFAQPEISVWKEDGYAGAKYGKGDGRAPRLPSLPPVRSLEASR